MPEIGIRSALSQCPFQIRMCDSAGLIATGTGFFYELNGDSFLVTTWHNISGRHAETKKCIDAYLRTPKHIEVEFASWIEGSAMTRWLPASSTERVEIYEGGEPLWFEHPQLGSFCDIVALPVTRPENCPKFMHNPANLMTSDKIPMEPGNTVFIIGFPHGISIGLGLPLWKSGFIASEPYFDITTEDRQRQLPAIFIDAQTRAGMSGSPVFASYTGSWDNSNPYSDLAGLAFQQAMERRTLLFASTGIELLGCYSGRVLGTTFAEAALGLCWRKEAIEHICASRKQGQHPHKISEAYSAELN